MTPRHPVRAALGAAFITLAMVAVFGNQWFSEHVYLKIDGQLARQLVRIPSMFTWRFTKLGSTTRYVAQLAGAVLVVVFVFFLVWAVAKRASGLALLVGGWGATVLAAMSAGFVEVLIEYGDLFPRGLKDPEGLGRVWYAVFNGAGPAALFGFAVGLVGGLLAMSLCGGQSQAAAPVLWQPGPAGGGYGGVTRSPLPGTGVGTDAPVDPTTPYINPYPSAPAPASVAGPYPYTSEHETPPPPPPGYEQADPTTVLPADRHDADPTTIGPDRVEWAPPPPSAASPSWSRTEDPGRHD